MNDFDGLLQEGIADGVFPGACYAVCNRGELRVGAAGRFSYAMDSPPVTLDAVWDLASLSKVIGTTTAVMLLVQEGRLDLDQPVCSIVEEFRSHDKSEITIRNLLLHNSGLVAFRLHHERFQSSDQVLSEIFDETIEYETGTQTIYSDLGPIVAAVAIERLVGMPLDQFLAERIFVPLGMRRTGYFGDFGAPFRPDECVPTETLEPWRADLRKLQYGQEGAERRFGLSPEFVQGEVHDPTAALLGGVAGHAGLFSTIGDLATFATSISTLIEPKTWEIFVTRHSDASTRAIGWDTKSDTNSSAGESFGPRSYGHTGFTGTSIWIDPESEKWSILLSNRVHPHRKNIKILDFRPKFNGLLT